MSIFPNAIKFMEAKDRQCRFFLPDQEGPDGLLCGEPTDDGASFCNHHHRVTHRASSDLRPKVRKNIDREIAPDPNADRELDLTEMFGEG